MTVVLAAAALHAGWNTLVKSRGDKLVASALVCFGAAIVGAPLLFFLAAPLPESIPYIIMSGIVHGFYFTFLGLAYQNADLSVVYPITRGTAPIMTTCVAALWIGEWLSPFAAAGVLVLSAGILWLSVDGLRRGGLRFDALMLALSNAFVVASYSLIDGMGGRLSGHPFSYNAWAGIAGAACFAPFLLWYRGREFFVEMRAGWRFGLLGGAMALTAYGIAIWAMTQAPIGMVAALRETSVIFGSVFAAFILHERFGRARWAAAALVVAGVVLMRL